MAGGIVTTQLIYRVDLSLRTAHAPLYLVLGTIFGFVLSRSGAADYNYIQGMFLFERVQLYGIIGTAVVLTAPGLWLIQRRGRTALGAPVQVELKPMTRGTWSGVCCLASDGRLPGCAPGRSW